MTSQIVNQEVIDAYYEYTHLTLDRRKFLSKLREMAETDNQPRPFAAMGDWQSLRMEAEAERPQ
jgi:hypothetical protein